jgi:hypothetical protein
MPKSGHGGSLGWAVGQGVEGTVGGESMNVHTNQRCGGSWIGANRAGGWVAAFAIGASAWFAWTLDGAPKVHAGEASDADSDADGLHDELEVVLGTNPSRFDTDGDGYSDGEEIARGSNPRRAQIVPTANTASLTIEAYAVDGRVHALTLAYMPNGVERDQRVRFGAEFNGRLLTLPSSRLRSGEPARVLPARGGVGAIVVLDPVLSEGWVKSRGGLSMFAILSSGGQYLAADTATLVAVDNQLFERVLGSTSLFAANSAQSGAPQAGTPVGGVYRPLTAGGGNSSASNYPGQICAQTTMVLGVVGALVTQEVVEAGCVDGWDAHCTAGCAGTVGKTIKSIDPAALIGG